MLKFDTNAGPGTNVRRSKTWGKESICWSDAECIFDDTEGCPSVQVRMNDANHGTGEESKVADRLLGGPTQQSTYANSRKKENTHANKQKCQ